ncbi:MAG: hypothetical protein H7243_05855, partial [Sphingomonadaceae bacterium]|nr:hypothetical protein [Sphingomonadaceae bacterium]
MAACAAVDANNVASARAPTETAVSRQKRNVIKPPVRPPAIRRSSNSLKLLHPVNVQKVAPRLMGKKLKYINVLYTVFLRDCVLSALVIVRQAVTRHVKGAARRGSRSWWGTLMKSVLLVAASVATLMTSMAATAREAKPQFTEFEDGFVNPPTDVHVGSGGSSVPLFFTPSTPTSVVSSFEGASDYTTRALGIGLIPPDTMGAVGRTQYVELINGSFSVYNKATGLLAAPRVTDSTFWRAAGGTATGGDPRIQFDAQQNRWLAIGFGANNANLQVAVSATSDALGVWRAATFTGYPGLGFGATADYPTLAVSGNSILIGTNNFAPSTAGGANSFRGTTLNILNKDQVFAATGPILTSLKQIDTPIDGVTDNGFAIQGVNRQGGSSTATVVASSLYAYDNVVYQVTNAGAPSGAQTASQYQAGGVSFESPNPGRQPVTGANARILATGDERTGTSAFDVNGRTYFATT